MMMMMMMMPMPMNTEQHETIQSSSGGDDGGNLGGEKFTNHSTIKSNEKVLKAVILIKKSRISMMSRDSFKMH